jgi:hypothetical protein
VPDPRAALREMHRATAAGGFAAFSVWGQREASPMFTLFPAALAALRAAGEVPPADAAEVRAAPSFVRAWRPRERLPHMASS